jgi:hypothetical protein
MKCLGLDNEVRTLKFNWDRTRILEHISNNFMPLSSPLSLFYDLLYEKFHLNLLLIGFFPVSLISGKPFNSTLGHECHLNQSQ